jgi:hypothetical protein
MTPFFRRHPNISKHTTFIQKILWEGLETPSESGAMLFAESALCFYKFLAINLKLGF